MNAEHVSNYLNYFVAIADFIYLKLLQGVKPSNLCTVCRPAGMENRGWVSAFTFYRATRNALRELCRRKMSVRSAGASGGLRGLPP